MGGGLGIVYCGSVKNFITTYMYVTFCVYMYVFNI